MVELRSEMNQQHYLRLASEKSLYDTTTELKRWRQEAKMLEVEKDLLKQKIDDLQFKLTNENQSELKTNTQEKTTDIQKNNRTNSNINDNENGEENKDMNLSIKLIPQTKFNPEKYNIKPYSKQELNLFCKERTLTHIENDLLCKSPCHSGSIQKYNIPDLSESYVGDVSFETFEDEISLNTPLPLPETSLTDYKTEFATDKARTKAGTKCLKEENKENTSTNLNSLTKSTVSNSIVSKPVLQDVANELPAKNTEPAKMKRKVCFSDDTTTEDKPKVNPLRGGKILVPKKKIILASNASKKV